MFRDHYARGLAAGWRRVPLGGRRGESERLRELTPGKLRVGSAQLSPLASDTGPSLAFEIRIHIPLSLSSLSLTHTHPLMKSDPCLSGTVPRALCTFTFQLSISDLAVERSKGCMCWGETTPQPSPAPLEGLSFKPRFLGPARKPTVGVGWGALFLPLPVANANNYSVF